MRHAVASCIAALALMGCEPAEEILAGERLDLDGTPTAEAAADVGGASLNLAGSVANAAWTHPNQNPQQNPQHVELAAAPVLAWSAAVTASEGRRHNLVAAPIIADGRIFVLGSRSEVVALNTAGQQLWSRDLTPFGDNPDDGSGGGLSFGADLVFASTGFGELVALDPDTGAIAWQQDLEAAGISPATVSQGLVYVTTRKGDAFALSPETGRIEWQISGPESVSNLAHAPAPTVTNKWALFPMGTGEVYSTFRRGGLRNWTSSVSGRRLGVAANQISDLVGGPLVSGERVFVGNNTGRTVALDLGTGDRIWTANEGVSSRMVTGGGSLFVVNDRNELLRLSQSDGSVIWRQPLPRYNHENPRKRDGIIVHFGPVLAGGQLIVASSDETLRFFDPATGAITRRVALPDAAAAAPSVAGGALYVLTTDGKLSAFR